MENQVVAEEVCLKEFDEWCDSIGIDHDVNEMDEESREDFIKNRNTLIKACKKGLLSFGDGELEYTISDLSPDGFKGSVLKIGQPTGKIFTAMDNLKDTQSFKKLANVMSAITGKDVGYFDKLHASDWRVLQVISVFFITI